MTLDLRLFTTCPPSSGCPGSEYGAAVERVARWSESHGCQAMLIYTDNGIVDPWIVADRVLRSTQALAPLVAVQPVYMHPYAVAKKVSTLGFLYDRGLLLNMVAGGFRGDLVALNDPTPHDQRYDRLIEYTQVIQGLLRSSSFSFAGAFYSVDKLKLNPPLREVLMPEILVSGSSDVGLRAAEQLAATAIRYPAPGGQESGVCDSKVRLGARVGVIARPSSGEAWEVAHARFPPDRRGAMIHKVAMNASDSQWHRQLSSLDVGEKEDVYWLHPFRTYKTFCPYLVGSYAAVAEQLSRYISVGYDTFILDIPQEESDLQHARHCFEMARGLVSRA